MLAVAMIFTLIMAFTACDREDENPTGTNTENRSPAIEDTKPTMVPGRDMALSVEGTASITPGDMVTYTVQLTECSVEEGLIGLDFSLSYDASAWEFDSCQYTKLPTESWEGAVRKESDGVLVFTAFDDTYDEYTPVVEAGQFQVEVIFRVRDDVTCGNVNQVFLFDISGAKNDENISMAYGYEAS